MSPSTIDDTTLERRLAAIEHSVADLQRRLADAPASTGWLEKVIGSITDEAAFLEALEYGRAYRETDRPADQAEAGGSS